MPLEAKNELGFIDAAFLNLNLTMQISIIGSVVTVWSQSWIINSTVISIIWINSARDIWLDLLTRFTRNTCY